jgi:hypothetical protein
MLFHQCSVDEQRRAHVAHEGFRSGAGPRRGAISEGASHIERAHCSERTGYYERNGVAYQVHFPTPYERAWGFGSAKLGETVTIDAGLLVPLEVWIRYRALCAAGEAFDIKLAYRGYRADPSVVLALGRLASGEWDRFALCLPASFLVNSVDPAGHVAASRRQPLVAHASP